jgi:hypothetical protein
VYWWRIWTRSPPPKRRTRYAARAGFAEIFVGDLTKAIDVEAMVNRCKEVFDGRCHRHSNAERNHRRRVRGGLRQRRRSDPASQARSHDPARPDGSPFDVANAAAFLASDDAAYITGVELMVDGGFIQRAG